MRVARNDASACYRLEAAPDLLAGKARQGFHVFDRTDAPGDDYGAAGA
jgi:hypothetical protein